MAEQACKLLNLLSDARNIHFPASYKTGVWPRKRWPVNEGSLRHTISQIGPYKERGYIIPATQVKKIPLT